MIEQERTEVKRIQPGLRTLTILDGAPNLSIRAMEGLNANQSDGSTSCIPLTNRMRRRRPEEEERSEVEQSA